MKGEHVEDANRLRLLLDKAEVGSDLEYQIIVRFLDTFALRERLDEARMAHGNVKHAKAVPANIGCQWCQRILDLERQLAEQGERT